MTGFQFFCSRCGQLIQADPGYSGKEINCPVCQQLTIVPPATGSPTVQPLSQGGGSPGGEPPKAPKQKTWLIAAMAAVLLLLIAGLAGFLFWGLHGKPSGMVACWRANGNARDSVGHNNGALQGDVRFAPGKFGRAFLFDTPDGAVKIPASHSLNVGEGKGFTIECWVNPSDVSQPHPIVEWNNGRSYGVHFYVTTTYPGNLYANIVARGGSGGTPIWTEAGVVSPNAFQHVALTYDKASGVARMYHNGEMVLEKTIGSFTPQTSYDVYLGRRPFDNGQALEYAGLIEDVGIYNRALSEKEIGAIFDAGADKN